MAVNFPETFWTTLKKTGTTRKEKVLKSYAVPVFNFIRSRGINEKDAEDLSQEVLIRITKDSFLDRADKDKGKFRTLLITVTKHVVIDFLRRQKRVLPLQTETAEDTRDFDRMWIENITSEAFAEIKKISAKNGVPYYDALYLRGYEGLSYSDIADRLNATLSDVKNWIHHGKKLMGKIVAEKIKGYSSSQEEFAAELLHFKIRR